ncbi:Leucine-rich repeat receptor-like tyrosine-protein kinase [Acorus calamus]|uniref:Leucine-rich repeat receptor-like tyrosine-protein kinase n=1 Tax=Acorus calamus TaxID=4465 RepID=A0AAV9C3J4_ACOCL|nr:Leucine-rich repeat receptor-like tyrosine-protein kinase [Acorus calamus]
MASILYLSLLMVFLSLSEAQPPDQPTMSALRTALTGPDWPPTGDVSDYCSWRGIKCDSSQSVIELDLSRRGLQGNLSSISGLALLRVLDLSFNSFVGSIPGSIESLSALEILDFSSNKFEGPIIPGLGRLSGLKSLNLSYNFLTGRIPDEMKSIEGLEELQLSGNNLSGSIPLWVGNLIQLKVFSAYENRLLGSIPRNLGSLSPLQVLNLHSNQLVGPIPGSIFFSGRLEILILTLNELNGSIPDSIGNCRGLSNVRIGNNRLTGPVPEAIGKVSGLTYFEADNNRLSGGVSLGFARCMNLTLLNLASNQLSGIVPPELGWLKNLQELIISDNGLTGEIPMLLLTCKSLNKLDLSNNRFNGSLPRGLCNGTRLQFLLLNGNSLTGEVPPEIGNCGRLLQLQLGGNYLTGLIPPDVGRLKNLQIALNLSFNGFKGPIPRDLGKLDKLVSLDVSNNQLTGSIPAELKGMLSLIEVNFSNNLLMGPIPIFGPFQKSLSSSFLGNKGLCGYPLNQSCDGSYGVEENHHKVSYKIVLAVIGSGLTVFMAVMVVVVLFMVRERQEMAAKAAAAAEGNEISNAPLVVVGNVFVENLKQAIDLESAVKASLKDSNKVGSGTFSTTYKAVMPSGLVLSVKQLKSIDRTVVHYQNKMVRELERLGNLCHENLMRPIGYVIYEDVALLLHHHMQNGTLFRLLHESSKLNFEPDWPRRLSIAVGIAEGLAFLHHVAIIHLDISSCNVFLDAGFKPLIGEIEVAKLLDPSKGTASISAVAGSFGYIPPEYAYTMQVTAPGNVYSYGVVLLEILTSRPPVDEAFGEGIDLVKWVHGASGRGETPEQIMDSRLSTVSFAWRRQMLGVLKVAMSCTETTPAKRPKMKKVVEMLLEAK